MSSYFIDTVYALNNFSHMGWKRTLADPPVHVYFQSLWEQQYMTHYKQTCEEFIMTLYTIVYSKMTKCMIDEAIKEVMKLVDWILTEGGMYLHICGGSQSLYKEIAKKTFIYGIGSSLAKATKASWPPLPLIR